MKNKKLISMAASLALVAVIGVGATLAYLSDTTGPKKNTFTVGKVAADLVEKNGNDEDWDDSVDGKDMYPGQTVTKKPILTIDKDAADCYAYLMVKGVDALEAEGFEVTGWDSNWVPLESSTGQKDGVYYYNQALDHQTGDADKVLEPLFSGVTYKETQEGVTAGTDLGIDVIGCVIQAEGFKVGDTVEGGILNNLEEAVKMAYTKAKPADFQLN